MMPRLGQKYEIGIETISKPKAEYLTDEYFELDLPVAPAVMVGEEILVDLITNNTSVNHPPSDRQPSLHFPSKQTLIN
jgi:hypothetical protein